VVGSQAEAQAAFDQYWRMVEVDEFGRVRQAGSLNGWQWWAGAGRSVWLPLDGSTVYKMEIGHNADNLREHEYMCEWRRQGYIWAPETELHTVDVPDTGRACSSVLAMLYYPCPITSADEIPCTAYERVPDLNLANFRRFAPEGQVMVIDAG
jgi:hypothetical protein